MRKRNITIYSKLPIIILSLLIFNGVCAKKKKEEANIICFAANGKWICAPEDQQEIARKKAAAELSRSKSELLTSDVVIKQINYPKFDAADKTKPIIQYISEPNNTADTEPKISQTTQSGNPYAKLWSHQLIGLSTPQSAINFVRDNNLSIDDVLIIKSIRAGMDWWIILFGLYKDKQTGLENAANLPKNITNAWLRPLKNLQVNGFIEKY